MIVDARGGNIGMSQPFLHLGDVGLMIESVGGSGRAQRVRANLEPKPRGVAAHQLVKAVRRDRAFGFAGAVVADRAEQRAGLVGLMTGGGDVVVNERIGAGMQRHIPRLAALAGHPKMRHALAGVLAILHPQLAKLLAAQRVEQQRRENGAVALALDGVVGWRVE